MNLSLAFPALCLSLIVMSPANAAEPVEFRIDVMAVLSKAGCNAGVCHGNLNGKGGFKLSLRGEDSDFDFVALTRDQAGRRSNPLEPDASLVLLKATMQVPHEGGKRFAVDSQEADILRRWIGSLRGGSLSESKRHLTRIDVTPAEQVVVEPTSTVPLRTVATFSDGSQRDVSLLAVYETSDMLASVGHDGLVRAAGPGETTIIVRYLDRQVPVRLAFVPARPDFAWRGPEPANDIDRSVFDKLRALRINPAANCDDSTFVRRAFLDLCGIIPTADEAREFARDSLPDKRARLIDELLQRPEFADCWALKWADLLRVEEKTLDRKGVQNFHAWIRLGIATGKPLDQFVRELIASRGSTYAEPASNYWRAMREPLMRAETTAQVFLGVRLQCAKCHNHPFDRWTQDDYYAWANVFARVGYKVLENNRRDRNDSHEFDGEQIVFMERKGEVDHPRRKAPVPPRVLASDAASVAPEADRLLELAAWVTRSDNEAFVRSQANRIWFHLLGRGVVDPIDDFRATNPAVNAALLDALARELVASRFDLRQMLRTIMNSRTYQFASQAGDADVPDVRNFARQEPRRLPAEQLLDSICRVTGVPVEFNGYPTGIRAGEIPGVLAVRTRDQRPSSADGFLRTFGKPPRLQACECERSTDATLSQTFQLVSGSLINEQLQRADNRLTAWLKSGRSVTDIVDELYWTALSRAPTPGERDACVRVLDQAADRRLALEDIAWGMINSNEFLLRQ
jgi:hypothetical protein